MRRRWDAWRFRQHSRIVFVLVPAGTRIVASGVRQLYRVVEVIR